MSGKKTTDNNFERKLNNIIDNIVEWFRNLFSGKKGTDEIINVFLTIVVMFILLWLLKIPFILLSAFGNSLIIFTFSPLHNILVGLWEVVVQLIYLVFAIFIVITIFKRIFSNNDTKTIAEKVIKEGKKVIEDNKDAANNLSIYSTVRVALKILVAIIMIPFVLFNIGLFIVLGILLAFWIEGTLLVGAIFITIGIFLIMASIMGVILKILTEGEIK